MRIPYVPQNPHTKDQDEAEILSRVLARRGSHGLLPLDRALLHSFPVADAWNTFLGAIRSKTTLSTALRELIICRVAVLNEAGFEWDHHAPILVETGFPQQSLDLLNTPDLKQLSTDDQAFSASDLAALQYTDEMTKNVRVSRDTFAQLKEHFNDREIVEITATVGAYNCVSRFLVALDVDERNNA
ncbi:hypothetical protein PV11_04159 [Exophiala sideris]|uniref:Carboxymuconolactone decarboxylase-like domain-containing protein n=1 Tax=Exophiala sideris TaxID=1016849 RepID=A0A0D1Z596_9EURO|nr:hypothetical protein PV11_04159 [Exophiala sideris]